MTEPRRRVDVLVVSDVHLGAACSRATELNAYLKSIDPARIVLCGDIIDLWEIRQGFWPEAHMKVVRRILKFALSGIPVHYITGNHDGALRHYSPFEMGKLELVDRLEMTIAGRKTLFIHGDAFDAVIRTPRWVTWLGTLSYDALVKVGTALNRMRQWMDQPPVSLAQMFKRNLPSAQRHIARYEEVVAHAAARRNCDTVICGHIHLAAQRQFVCDGREVQYLNSGDWVDSCTALECIDGSWKVVHFHELVEQGLIDTRRLQEGTQAQESAQSLAG